MASEQAKVLEVLGVRVDLIQIPDVLKQISFWIANGQMGNYVVFSNAHDLVFSKRDSQVKNAVNHSSLTVADGFSLVLLSRLRGQGLKKRVYGPDLMLEFLRLAQEQGYSNFFYGSTPQTLEFLIKNLKHKFPKLKISGSYSPPFVPLTAPEDARIIEIINQASPDVLWVGLGTPKQQLWMHEHRHKLKVPAMLGVGAAFDFFAKTKPQAPKWIRNHGFEWLFRLITEPKRLWRRYLIDNFLFVYYLITERAPKPKNHY